MTADYRQTHGIIWLTSMTVVSHFSPFYVPLQMNLVNSHNKMQHLNTVLSVVLVFVVTVTVTTTATTTTTTTTNTTYMYITTTNNTTNSSTCRTVTKLK